MANEPGDVRDGSAQGRGAWPVRKYHLGEEPADDLRDTTTAEERLAMMWPLALAAWSLMGEAMPDYDRSTMPIRILRRRSDSGSDSNPS